MPDELYLEIREFHCMGKYGVGMGWGKDLKFECMVKASAFDASVHLICKECGSFAGRITMSTRVHTKSLKRPADTQLDAKLRPCQPPYPPPGV